jgi:hypothetical protein
MQWTLNKSIFQQEDDGFVYLIMEVVAFEGQRTHIKVTL